MKQRWFPLEPLIKAARSEGQLTVMGMPRDWCSCGALIDSFQAKYGVPVVDLKPSASSAVQLDTIKHAMPAPDVIDVGLSFGASAKREGLLQPYKVSTWSTIPDPVKDVDGRWYGHYYGTLAFEINADVIRTPPLDWPDLLAPDYWNAVALAGDPCVAHQGIQSVYAAGLSSGAGGPDAARAGLAFMAELARRGNLYPRVGDFQSLCSGETPVLIRWDFLALGDRDRSRGNPRIEVVVPRTGRLAGIYVQGISATAAHPSAARLWMEHLYSDESQLSWLSEYCHPIRLAHLMQSGKTTGLLERLPEFREQPPVEPVFPTPEEEENARDIITKGWDDIVGVRVPCESTPPTPPKSRPPTSFRNPPGDRMTA